MIYRLAREHLQCLVSIRTRRCRGERVNYSKALATERVRVLLRCVFVRGAAAAAEKLINAFKGTAPQPISQALQPLFFLMSAPPAGSVEREFLTNKKCSRAWNAIS
jgi:hypothetical protein